MCVLTGILNFVALFFVLNQFFMSATTVFLIAIGLSMDSFSVSFANGIYYLRFNLSKITLVALTFALVQALFTVMGWYVGQFTISFFKDVDHWIAFGLLMYIGLKMIFEKDQHLITSISIKSVIMQAIATSIDALVVGFGLGTLGLEIAFPAMIIGLFTFVFAFTGMIIGKFLKKQINFKTTIIGGLILIFIGLKILFEHLNEHYFHWF